MKQGIHPEYVDSVIICACGQKWETKSTKPEIHVETCSVCHPFYTGNQRGTKHFGRAEQFYLKYGSITLDEKPAEEKKSESKEKDEETPVNK